MTLNVNNMRNQDSENISIAENIFDPDTIIKIENQLSDANLILFKRNYIRILLRNLPLIILELMSIGTNIWLFIIISQRQGFDYFFTKNPLSSLYYMMLIVILILLVYLPILLPRRVRKLPTGIAITPKHLQIKSKDLVEQEILWGNISEITIWRGWQEVTKNKIPVLPMKNYRVKIHHNKSVTEISSKEYLSGGIDIIPKFDSFKLAFKHRKYDVLTLLIEYCYQKNNVVV